ncbi:MAG TPA: FtsQ-type POTRA domain-containing protein [Burkholderiaceae bacterium]|nr:FtsQ-type POTRA domain-containing protein [Burkholderiaceae bacterium]
MNPWHDVRLLNAVANGLTAVAAIALLAGATSWTVHRPAFTLRAVVVEPASDERPLQHVSRATLRASGAVRPAGTFFTVNLDSVREQFESVPWVRRAQVRRIWPNTLRVAIEEHRPLAVWADGRIVNRQGELFVANVAEAEADGELLEFSGPPGSEGEVARRWTELRDLLAPLSLVPQAVALSSRWAWSARLDDGTTLLLGRDQGMPLAERVARWVAMHGAVRSRLNREVVAVDLRYPNGFAIRAPGALDKAALTAARPGTAPRPASATRPNTTTTTSAASRGHPDRSKRSQ